jgi:hypothetical protein
MIPALVCILFEDNLDVWQYTWTDYNKNVDIKEMPFIIEKEMIFPYVPSIGDELFISIDIAYDDDKVEMEPITVKITSIAWSYDEDDNFLGLEIVTEFQA